jgi:hypothetical protein
MTKTITGAIKSAAVAVKAAVVRELPQLATPDEPLTHATEPDGFVRFGGPQASDLAGRCNVNVPVRFTRAAFAKAIEDAPGDLATNYAVVLHSVAAAARNVATGNVAVAHVQHDRTERSPFDGNVRAAGIAYTTDLVAYFARSERTGVAIEVTLALPGEAATPDWHATIPPSAAQLAAEQAKAEREAAEQAAHEESYRVARSLTAARREIDADMVGAILALQIRAGIRNEDGSPRASR